MTPTFLVAADIASAGNLLMLGIAAAGFLLTWATTARSQGRIEGTVSKGLEGLGEKVDEYKAEVNTRFNDVHNRISEVKRDIEGDIEKLRQTDTKQWEYINDQGRDITRLQTKANGKAAS